MTLKKSLRKLKHFMPFDNKSEKIYRVVHELLQNYQEVGLPIAAFDRCKLDITSETGISVDRAGDRDNYQATADIAKRFKKHKPDSSIISFPVHLCDTAKIHINESPSRNNRYHCDLWGNLNDKDLSKKQKLQLADNHTLELMRIGNRAD